MANSIFIWPGLFSVSGGVLAVDSSITSMLLPAGDYINFGATAGTNGYGFRDNSGTMQFKDSGGSWNDFPAGGAAPADATYILKTANASLANAQALSALSTGVLLATTTTGVVSSLGVGTVAQALIGGTTPAFGNAITVAGIAATSTDGWVLQNTTAATGGVPVQISPRSRWVGTAWDTAASQTVAFFAETLPATAATPTGTWKLGYSLNGAAATYPLTVTNAGAITTTGDFRLPSGILRSATIAGGNGLYVRNAADNANGNFEAVSLVLDGKMFAYNGVTTAGWGVPAIYAAGRVGPITNATSASIATYTVGAADGSFEVSANCNITTSTTYSFSLNVLYTDEANQARVLVLPVASLAGTFLATGLITNITGGVGPYETPVMHIRCKASSAITIQTSSGGTYTTVVYTAEGIIKQMA